MYTSEKALYDTDAWAYGLLLSPLPLSWSILNCTLDGYSEMIDPLDEQPNALAMEHMR